MADYVLTLVLLIALSITGVAVQRRVFGVTTSARRAVARIGVVCAVSALLVAGGTYVVSKSRSFQLAGTLVTRVDTTDKLIALTFDDGPEPVYTEQVLDLLATYEAPATFYVLGEAAKRNPVQVRRIIDAGHELGNHSFSHPRMYFMPSGSIAREVESTDAVLKAAGYRGNITFRPPGCKRLLATPIYLARYQRTTVTWDLEPDSIANIAGSADAMTDYVVENARPGSIVLMHVMYPSSEVSREALPQIMARLSAEGYTFVTVSQLMEAGVQTR